jgi:hypothetical protein
MDFKSKKTPLLILAIPAIVCSRAWFFFINDPEGPNLVVVMGLAVILYFLSVMAYVLVSATVAKKLLAAISMQILVAICLYFLLK